LIIGYFLLIDAYAYAYAILSILGTIRSRDIPQAYKSAA